MSATAKRTILLYMVDRDERAALASRMASDEVRVIEVSQRDDNSLASSERLAAFFVEVKTGDDEGLAVIRELHKSNTPASIVVLSSNRDMESRKLARDAGANDFLATPVRNIDLEFRVAHCLAQSLEHERASEVRRNLDALEVEKVARELAEAEKAKLEPEPEPVEEPPAAVSKDLEAELAAVAASAQQNSDALEIASRQLRAARLLVEAAREESLAAREETRKAHEETQKARKEAHEARADAARARADAEAAQRLTELATEEMLERETRTRQLQSQAQTLIEVAEQRNGVKREPARAPSVSGESRSSDVDGLTGLLGDGPFQDHLDREYARARRYGHALSILLLDVDRLGRYSKRHGRAAGDAAVRLIADVLRVALRSPDIVARPGSDTFAVIATDTSEDESLLLAERLQAAFAEEGEHASLPAITVSIGIASAQSLSVARASDLFAAAEGALAAAKRGGRNRCFVAVPR